MKLQSLISVLNTSLLLTLPFYDCHAQGVAPTFQQSVQTDRGPIALTVGLQNSLERGSSALVSIRVQVAGILAPINSFARYNRLGDNCGQQVAGLGAHLEIVSPKLMKFYYDVSLEQWHCFYKDSFSISGFPPKVRSEHIPVGKTKILTYEIELCRFLSINEHGFPVEVFSDGSCGGEGKSPNADSLAYRESQWLSGVITQNILQNLRVTPNIDEPTKIVFLPESSGADFSIEIDGLISNFDLNSWKENFHQ